MITKFNKFNVNENMISLDDSELRNGEYLTLKRLENGNLKISLTEEGKEEINNSDYEVESDYLNLFDDIVSNSSIVLFSDISQLGFMSESPGITIGYYFSDEGEYTDEGNEDWSEVFYYPNYQIKDFTEDLKNEGYVIFKTTGVLTPEEFEEFKLNKTANKFNL